MRPCFARYNRAVGYGLVAITTLTEAAGLAFYIHYYVHFLAQPPGPAEPLARSVDAGSVVGVTVTVLSVLLCNILLFYGVWRRKLICFLPWLMVHAALFFEAVIALAFFVFHSVRTSVRHVSVREARDPCCF